MAKLKASLKDKVKKPLFYTEKWRSWEGLLFWKSTEGGWAFIAVMISSWPSCGSFLLAGLLLGKEKIFSTSYGSSRVLTDGKCKVPSFWSLKFRSVRAWMLPFLALWLYFYFLFYDDAHSDNCSVGCQLAFK